MSVRLDGQIIRLEGRCYVEDAELLVVLLQGEPGRVVDCSEAETLHTAIIQVLIVFAPQMRGGYADAFIERWVAPFFAERAPTP